MLSKNTDRISVSTVRICGVPVSNVKPANIGYIIDNYIVVDEPSQIVFLSWWGLIRAICKLQYKALVNNATLVIPTSPLISLGAFILHGKRLNCHSDFNFIIRVMSRLELQNKSIYLLGMEMNHVQIVEQNIRNTFPKLMVVGRYSGYFSSVQEQQIVSAICKTNTTFLFAGDGVPNKDIWLYRVKHKIKPCIMIWSGVTMKILAGTAQKPPAGRMQHFFYVIRQMMRRPWRVYRLFVFLFYFFSLLCMRLLRRS